MGERKSVFLDVDSRIVENNLRITDIDPENDFSKLLGQPNREYPSKLVKPRTGFCVKTREAGSNIKVFVNICQTEAIPPPRDISETELIKIIESEEESTFRVPMSIGDLQAVKDKKGDEAKQCDIAINPSFFHKIESIETFKSFFMAVVFQGLENKYGLICVDTKVILPNRKAYGTLQMHRIQQREMDEKMGKVDPPKSMIEELTGEKEIPKKVVIETISEVENKTRVPDYRLYKKKDGTNCLTGEFRLPDILSAKEITLDIGEDRIVLESKSKGYLLDIFVPCFIRSTKCTSTFDKASRVLKVTMPLMGG